MNFTTDVLFSSVVEILQFKKTKTTDIAKSEKKIIFGSISVFSSFNFVLQDYRSHNIYIESFLVSTIIKYLLNKLATCLLGTFFIQCFIYLLS